MQERIEVLRLDSRELDLSDYPTIDLSYIDGCHSYGGVKADSKKCAPRLKKRSVVVFDDYFNRFPGVQTFVNEWAAVPGVRFYGQQDHDIGLVFDEVDTAKQIE